MYTDEELKEYYVSKTNFNRGYISSGKFPSIIKEVQKIADDWKLSIEDLELAILDSSDGYESSYYSLYVTTDKFPRTNKEIEEELVKAKQIRKEQEERELKQLASLQKKYGNK